MKKTALSGIQTTGTLHLGNYLGSIHHWLNMQEDYNCYFFLANLHSITTSQDPEALRSRTLSMAGLYLASGLDPQKSIIFKQSDIKSHTELAWILNCITPLGWLKRITQFKDKVKNIKGNINTGLLTYPVLMAADILLYNADIVPVGSDQKQHLELARDIVKVINTKFNQEILKMPEPFIKGKSTRVMSLKTGITKMSKSDQSDASRINLTDSADTIIKKITKAKTDNHTFISYDQLKRPELSNLLNIYSSITKLKIEEIVKQHEGIGLAKFKYILAEIIIEELSPIHNRYHKIIQDTGYIQSILYQGATKANIIADMTCQRVSAAFGIR